MPLSSVIKSAMCRLRSMEKWRLSVVKATISRSLGALGGGDGEKNDDGLRPSLRGVTLVSEDSRPLAACRSCSLINGGFNCV